MRPIIFARVADMKYYKGITDTDRAGEFSCTGGIEVAGVRIKCWRYYRPHRF